MRLRRRASDRSAPIALAVLALLAAIAMVGPALVTRDPNASGDLTADKLLPPSATHLFGTDAAARDVFARVVHGTRVSLGIAVLSVGIVAIVGIAWGTTAGLASRRLDDLLMRTVDALLATPRLLVVLAIVAFTGQLGAFRLALLLGVTGWAQMSRVVRGRVRELRNADHVVAARAVGTPTLRVVLRHILPDVVPAVLVTVVLAFASVIPLEASLSYIGAGIAPPTASWGALLRDATDRPLDAWWLILFPGAAIAATIMSITVLSDRLQRGAATHLPR